MRDTTARKDPIQSVKLVVETHGGKKLEIPLAVWQVDAVREMLGLCVDTNTLDTYRMRSKERVDENMDVYHRAVRELREARGNEENV